MPHLRTFTKWRQDKTCKMRREEKKNKKTKKERNKCFVCYDPKWAVVWLSLSLLDENLWLWPACQSVCPSLTYTHTHIAHRPLHKIAMTMTIRYTATATCHSFFNRSSLSPMPLAASQKVLNSFYILLLHVSSKESLTVMRDCQCQVDPVRIPSNRDRMNSRSRNNSNNNEIK